MKRTLDGWMFRWSALSALCAAVGAAVFGFGAVSRITYPYLTNLGEPALAQSIRFARLGIWPYHDLSSPPFSVVPYGPVYLGLSAWVQSFFDLPMAGGRAVCLAATLTAAVLIGLILRRLSGSITIAVGTAGLFLSLPFVGRWGAQVNVDMTAAALELGALTSFYFYAVSGYFRKKLFWIGWTAAVAAFFTKSSAGAAVAAWMIHLAMTRRWRELATFALTAGGAVAAIYAALNFATDGQYYFHTTLEIGRRVFFWRFVRDYWTQTALFQPVCVLAAAAALARPAMWKREDGQNLLNLHLLFTVLVTVSLGKQGSDTNYLLPFMTSSALAAGRLWSRAAAAGPGRFVGAAAAAGVALQAVLLGGVIGFSPAKAIESRTQKKAFYDRLSAVIRQFPDPIISWDMTLLVANGRPVYFEPFPMAQAAYSGVWDQTPILEDLRSGRIRLVVTYFWSKAIKADRNFTPEFVSELRAHYRLAGIVRIPDTANQRLFFYVPKTQDR